MIELKNMEPQKTNRNHLLLKQKKLCIIYGQNIFIREKYYALNSKLPKLKK